jgi:hypothetical protein
MALVRKRTIPTERPPLVGEVNANFYGYLYYFLNVLHFYIICVYSCYCQHVGILMVGKDTFVALEIIHQTELVRKLIWRHSTLFSVEISIWFFHSL